MRDHLRTTQQLHKLPNRKLKWSSDQSRSPKKIVKQCFDSVIDPGSDDASINLAKDCDDIQVDESSVENSVNSPSAAVSALIASSDSDLSPLHSTFTSDGSRISSDLSPLRSSSTLTADASPVSSNLSLLASTITSDKVQINDVKVNHPTADLCEYVKEDSGKTELFAKKFRQSGTQRMNSDNMILLSKSVLEELLKIVIDELHNVPEKRDWLSEMVEKKVMKVLGKVFLAISTFMLLTSFIGIFIFSSDGGNSYNEFVPT